jgi:hypothetical protein
MSVRGNTEARALLTFTDGALTIEPGNAFAQLATLDARFSGRGWVVPQLLAATRTAPDFYFEEATQISLPTWSRGRVVLVGDAAHCLRPLGDTEPPLPSWARTRWLVNWRPKRSEPYGSPGGLRPLRGRNAAAGRGTPVASGLDQHRRHNAAHRPDELGLRLATRRAPGRSLT